MSIQQILSNDRNHARAAIIGASSVRPAAALETLAVTRAGNGRVKLAGAYTGHAAADIDIEITTGGTTPRASQPVFHGIGSGALDISVVDPAAVEQGITLTLADLGVNTEAAGLDVREVRIVARNPGAAGNSIRITIAPSLTETATAWALIAAWPASSPTQTGDQWNFGALPLRANGELDAASPRVRFGTDPTVYRLYREYKSGAWHYGTSPALDRDIPAGTPVRAISGGYDVSITNGPTTESYAAIITFYELLSALTASALLDVAGVVAADRRIGGQAAIDIPLRTSAWLFAVGGKVQLDQIAVPPDAPTQAVTIRCINADTVGRERWSVSGSVSGALAPAVTGDAYTSAAASFLVPTIAPATADGGEWSFKYEPAAREAAQGIPSVCLRPFRFGRNARARTVTFRYQPRPPADCKCSDMPAIAIDLACLGFEGDATMPGGITDPIYVDRVKALYTWREGFVQANTSAGDAANPYQTFYAEMRDINLADGALQIMLGALPQVYEEPSALAEWDLMWVDIKDDLAVLAAINQPSKPPGNQPTNLSEWVVEMTFLERYRARMINILILVGIFPNSDASSDAGACWQDYPDETHWWADVDGYYLPAFTNKPYISARRNTETGEPFSTMEFGFGLVIACPERLLVGDTLTVRIMTVDGDRPYQVGDEAIIETIAAGPAWLAGGVDGTDELTWRVAGNVSGPQPDYVVPLAGPAPDYAAAGITLKITPGGVPFALGDQFAFSVEAGRFRWRKNGGAWSAATDIPLNSALLGDGLSAEFTPGAAPSFAASDYYAYRAHQPHAPDNLRHPGEEAWAWSGSGATATLDLGAPVAITCVGLARYHLPPGATIQLEHSADGASWSAPVSIPLHARVTTQFIAPIAARHVRITVSDAPAGYIGWLWLGQPLGLEATQCTRRRRHAITRAPGINPAGLYHGSGDGWTVGWEDWLTEAAAAEILALAHHVSAHDEPIIFMPHRLHPADAALVTIDTESIDIQDRLQYQPDDAGRRMLSAALQLNPVLA